MSIPSIYTAMVMLLNATGVATAAATPDCECFISLDENEQYIELWKNKPCGKSLGALYDGRCVTVKDSYIKGSDLGGCGDPNTRYAKVTTDTALSTGFVGMFKVEFALVTSGAVPKTGGAVATLLLSLCNKLRHIYRYLCSAQISTFSCSLIIIMHALPVDFHGAQARLLNMRHRSCLYKLIIKQTYCSDVIARKMV